MGHEGGGHKEEKRGKEADEDGNEASAGPIEGFTQPVDEPEGRSSQEGRNQPGGSGQDSQGKDERMARGVFAEPTAQVVDDKFVLKELGQRRAGNRKSIQRQGLGLKEVGYRV